MKKLHLSIIATTCMLALTACSSSNGTNAGTPITKNNLTAADTPRTSNPPEANNQNNKANNNQQNNKKPSPNNTAQNHQPQNNNQLNNNQPNTNTPNVTPPPTQQTPQLTEEERARLAAEAETKRMEEVKTAVKNTFVNNGLDVNDVSQLSGSLFTINKDKITAKNIDPTKNNDLNELVIEDTKLRLFSKELIEKHYDATPQLTIRDIVPADVIDGATGKNYSGKVGSLPSRRLGDDFAQFKYGYISVDGINTLFVQGHMTPLTKNIDSPYNHYYHISQPDKKERLRVLPTEGSFKYKGYAFYGKDNYETLEAQAVADLTNKKVKVDLLKGADVQLTFGGVIEGNTFEGIYQGVQSKGAFYGTKGQDIGGIFYHTEGEKKDHNGVFGVTKEGDTGPLTDFSVNK